MQLRAAQEAILAYQNGRMAVSAVPGSGKTFTLSLLAAQLIAGGYRGDNNLLNPRANQQVLVVTYLNASVDTFKARLRRQLEEMALPPDHGYDVRTLHSLALEIVRISESGLGPSSSEPAVLDETQSSGLGLTVVHSDVTHLGGTIDLDSPLDEGTTITVSLPLAS